MEKPVAMGELPTNGTTNVPATNDLHNEVTTAVSGLSAEEIALYDRQIRLWGAQAQERIRSAKILLISLRALGTEVAKNLTLAGISALTIVDQDPVQEEDLASQFFLREGDVGKPRAEAAIPHIQELNPLVKVQAGPHLDDLLNGGEEHYLPYDCVIICDHDVLIVSAIDTMARMLGKPVYIAGIHGFFGFIFADLSTHEFVIEREKSNVSTKIGPECTTRQVLSVTTRKETSGKTTEIVKKSEAYCPFLLANSSPLATETLSSRRKLKGVTPLLPCLRALWDFQRSHARLPGHTQQDLAEFTTLATIKSRELQLPPETLRSEFLRSFMQNIGSEITPTAAFVGGRLSEDVINVLGKREQPIQNFALFDGDALEGKIYSLHPPPDIAMMAAANPPPDTFSLAGMAQFGDLGGMGVVNGMQMGMPGDMSTGIGMMGMNMPMGNGVAALTDMGQAGLPQGMHVGSGASNEPQQVVPAQAAQAAQAPQTPHTGEQATAPAGAEAGAATGTGESNGDVKP